MADVLGLPFLRWIWRFPRDTRPRVVAALVGHPNAVVLRSRREARRWLQGVVPPGTGREIAVRVDDGGVRVLEPAAELLLVDRAQAGKDPSQP